MLCLLSVGLIDAGCINEGAANMTRFIRRVKRLGVVRVSHLRGFIVLQAHSVRRNSHLNLLVYIRQYGFELSIRDRRQPCLILPLFYALLVNSRGKLLSFAASKLVAEQLDACCFLLHLRWAIQVLVFDRYIH